MLRVNATDLILGIHSSTGSRVIDGRLNYNLDRYTVIPFESSKPQQPPTTLAIVTDTMGRSFQGNNWDDRFPPSQVVIEAFVRVFDQEYISDTLKILSLAFAQASRSIRHLKNAAVTCVVVVIKDKKLFIASCGDCRVFLLQQGKARCISIAHTFAEKLIEEGYITAEEIGNHPYDARGPLRALGYWESGEDHQKPDLRLRLHPKDSDEQAVANQGLSLFAGDKILLCSGCVFKDYITAHEQKWLEKAFFDPILSPQTAVDHFISPIRQQNDVSDLTAVLLQIPDTYPVFNFD